MQLQPQRILTKSPLKMHLQENQPYTYQYKQRTQEEEIWRSKTIDLEKRLEAYYQQNQDLKQLIADYQKAVHNQKIENEELQSAIEQYIKQIKDLSEQNYQLRQENQRMIELENQIEELKSNNQVLLDDFNRQLEGTLRARIETDIKEIHNKYLREIQQLKQKIMEYEKQSITNPLQKQIDELILGIEQKNNYIDELLIKIG